MHDTPLGPLAGGLTLRHIGLRDRLRELDFEIPLAGGDLSGRQFRTSGCRIWALLLREHLGAGDPLRRTPIG